MSTYEFTVALSIRHPSIDPDDITQILRLEPQHAWKAGDKRCAPTGESIGGTHRESYWTARVVEGPQSSSDAETVEDVLLQLLVQLRRSQDWFSRLKAEAAQVEVSVSIFGRDSFALEMPHELIAMLTRLGLALTLEVHPQPPAAAPRGVQ